jgi:hypothetical protein
VVSITARSGACTCPISEGPKTPRAAKATPKYRTAVMAMATDTAQSRQLDAMGDIFGEIWSMTVAEGRYLYNTFPSDTARADVQSFRAQGRGKIEEYNTTLVSKQVAVLWRERTGTESPDEWSRQYSLPAECVLAVEDAKGIIDAVTNSKGVSADRLHNVLKELEKDSSLVDVATAGEKFLKRVLPARYLKIDFSVGELSGWLCKELSEAPNSWLTDLGLREDIERFIKQGYDSHVRKKAAEKVNVLSDADAKKLLLNLIDQIPDVGLSLLE